MKMRFKMASFFVILLILLVTFKDKDTGLIELINQEFNTTPTSSGRAKFDLLDATQFTDLMYPWLGFPVTVLSEEQLLGGGDHTGIPPDELKVKNALIQFKDKKRIILNLPSYQIKSDKKEDVLAALHMKWYLQVIQYVRDVLPDADIGILDLPYSPWTALKSKANISNYQQVIEYLKPVIDATDTLYPMFKIFNYDENDLSYLMGVQLYTAKVSGKPVYPVLSHKNIIVQAGDESKFIPVNLIKQQCKFVRKNADGMVWWSAKQETWENHWYDTVSTDCFY